MNSLGFSFIETMAPRWKGKGSKAKALADPMSKIILELQSSLTQFKARGLLSGCSVIIGVEAEQSDLLNRACLGRSIITADKDKQWFQLGMEEAYYLCFHLNCLEIIGEDDNIMSGEELWQYMKSKKITFPMFYKAYSHLRMKNWVVRSGLQYGVDFVAYRHHPSLVHSEYAVLVLSKGDENGGGDADGRLSVWSDIHGTVRLCGSVAKTLLVLDINKNGHGTASASCLDSYVVGERTIMRWNPDHCRENQTEGENESK